MILKRLFGAVYFAIVLISIPATALAYLDPGSGSFIVQMLIASIAGITYMVRAYVLQGYYFIKHTVFGFSKKEKALMDVVESDESN